MSSYRVVCIGLGPIGIKAAELAAGKSCLEIVGAVDIAPDKVGRGLDKIVDGGPANVTVHDDIATCLRETKPDVAIHCTSSFLATVDGQLLQTVEAGVNVISSTEELLYPRLYHTEIADRIDAAAASSGVTVLGTGINPGFLMDALPGFATAVCYDVDKITCRRYVDASNRRGPFQKKIGAGMDEASFRELADAGKLGHIGLPQSIAMLGEACGFELDEIQQHTDPILANGEHKTDYVHITAGQVAGIHNTGFGKQDGQIRVEMDLRMYIGAENPIDEIVIEGNPDLTLQIPGGTHGDFATAAMLVNGIPRVVRGPAGLKTMLELPIPTLLR